MELTGKCKQKFEDWYIGFIRENRPDYLRFSLQTVLLKFYRSVGLMKFGVYQEFFSSIGLIVEAQRSLNEYKYYVAYTPRYFQAFNATSRLEAQIKAIEEANEAINRVGSK